MGRPLKGPIRIGNSPTYYARLTVKPAQRAAAGTSRLHKSLGTTDKTIALQRWPMAYAALQDELKLRLQLPLTEHHLIRARLEAGHGATRTTWEEEAGAWNEEKLDAHDQASEILNVQSLDQNDPLHEEVFKAVQRGSLTTWTDLLENHGRVRLRKTGKTPAPGTVQKTESAIKAISGICPFPSQLTKDKVKEMVAMFERQNCKPITISGRLGLLKALVTSGIRSDLLAMEVNPFTLVDFSAVSNKEDSRKEFNKEQIKVLLSSQYGEQFRVLLGTGMRITEMMTRDLETDLQGNMLVVRWNEKKDMRTKTESSIRRVPLDDRAIKAVKDFYALELSNERLKNKLREAVRALFNDRRLVVHSCRHSFKSITRAVGMPAEVSDEISGHAKANVNPTADGYGSYPDELLLKENQKVWDYLDSI